MNEMEQRARMRNLDDLASEMDRYEADRYKSRKTQPQINVAVKEVEAAPELPPENPAERGGEDANPASIPISPEQKDEKKFYLDPNRQKALDDAMQSDASEEVRKALMSRGQFGQSRKG